LGWNRSASTWRRRSGSSSPAKAQELAKSLTKGQGRDQVSKAAKDLMAWSNKNKERLTSMVQTEVKSQLKTIGVASRDEVDALRKRVRELEREQGKKVHAQAVDDQAVHREARHREARHVQPSRRAGLTPGP
jgi:polyhydroxyalkanoate synthesis regulator phasin